MKDSFWKWIWVALLLILLSVVLLFATGCEVLKTRKELRSDTTSVKKTEVAVKDTSSGGSVKTTDTKIKDEYDWFRIIQQFSGKGDTTIVNNNHYPQPATIIYEGGKGTREQTTNERDSSYYSSMMTMVAASIDSMNRKLETIDKSKHSETKGLGLTMVLLIVGGFWLLTKGVGFVASNYSVTKKSK